jgi:hypothetical protein
VPEEHHPLAIDETKFRAFNQGGITIERDSRAKSRILELASRNLESKRRGTELDDHISSDTICQRKAVLERVDALAKVESDDSPAEARTAYSHYHDLHYNPDVLSKYLDGQRVVWFGLGHGFQDTILGPEAEKPIWVSDEMVYASPDGLNVFGDGELHEVKTTRRGPTPKKQKYLKSHPVYPGEYMESQSWSIEEKLFRVNPSWFSYILKVMYITGIREYYLTMAWIAGADMETFKITATDNEVEDEWELGKLLRSERRRHVKEGTLPSVSTRAFPAECENCPYLTTEPCASEVPVINAQQGA